MTLGGVVRPHRANGIVGVDDGDYPGKNRDIFAFEALRVTAAIDGLVMVKNDNRNAGNLCVPDRRKNVMTAARMRSHHFELLVVEAPRLVENAVGYADFSDIVELGCPAQNYQVLGRKTKRPPGFDSERASSVAVRERVFIALAKRF